MLRTMDFLDYEKEPNEEDRLGRGDSIQEDGVYGVSRERRPCILVEEQDH